MLGSVAARNALAQRCLSLSIHAMCVGHVKRDALDVRCDSMEVAIQTISLC